MLFPSTQGRSKLNCFAKALETTPINGCGIIIPHLLIVKMVAEEINISTQYNNQSSS